MAIDAAGQIVLGGQTQRDGTGTDFALARYSSDGSLDTTLGGTGIVATDFTSSYDGAYGVAIDAAGQIVLAGFSHQGVPSQGGTGTDFAAVRYNTDGSLDTTFGSGGLVTTDFAASYDEANDVAIDAAGQIVLAGSAYLGNTTRYDFAVVRYNTDGSLDTTFDTDGKVATHFDVSNNVDEAYGVAIDAAGKIVAAGQSVQDALTYEDFALARYNSDGSLDITFDGDGKVTTDFGRPGTTTMPADPVAIQLDGKIVVAGSSDQNGCATMTLRLVRYNSDGSLDSSFDGDGKVITDFDYRADHA